MPPREVEPTEKGITTERLSHTEQLSRPAGLVALEGAVRSAGVIDVHELDIEERMALNAQGGAVLAWGGYGMTE